MKSKKSRNIVALIIVIVLVFAAGLAIGVRLYKAPAFEKFAEEIAPQQEGTFGIDSTGFVVANVSIDGTTVTLANGCYEISFDVTDDQAYSIHRATERVMGARPLTHDILKDIMENFNISIKAARIERFGDEIYYARMFVQRNNNVLDIDLRPSDAIALSLRTGNELLINETMLRQKGTNICR